MREETTKVVDSVRETIEIGELGGLPTQVTHHKIIGKANWGKTVDTLRLIDEARARGVDATIDQYPYTASATAIGSALLPSWALEGGREATLKKMTVREKLGQMLMPHYFAVFTSADSAAYKELLHEVEINHVGGFLVGTQRGPLGIERSQVYDRYKS